MDKNHPGQNLPDKRPLTKPPGQKPPRTIEREFVKEAFVRVFVLGLLKIGGGAEMCDVLSGVPGCVTKCDKREGGQNWQKIAWGILWKAPHGFIKTILLN